MKSTLCRHCKHYYPKGTTPYPYDVCNFMHIKAGIQTLGNCPNGKPDYSDTTRLKQRYPSE